MKLLTILLTIGTFVLVLSGCGSETNIKQDPVSQQTKQDPVSQQADFPRYDFESMINGNTDLVVVAKVTGVSENKDNNSEDPNSTHQEATLSIQDKIFGDEPRATITLYQSVDRVEKNKTYLLFLSYRDSLDVFVVSDGQSQMEINNNKVKVDMKGIEGEYTLDMFKNVFKEKVDKIKMPK